MITTIIFITLAWFGGASAMWIYLRFVAKLIRNQTEHHRALREEFFHPRDSHGLVGAIYKADTTEFKEYVKNYFKDGNYLPQLQDRGERTCEK